jgi:hypothetical protein
MNCETCGGWGETWTGFTVGDIYPFVENPFEKIMVTCKDCKGSGLAPPKEDPLG